MKRFLLLSFMMVFSSSVFSADTEEKKEKYFHRVYEKYHSRPTSEEMWEKAIALRESKEYSVLKGDTLWDISKTLFADGFFWSKIWSLNPFITNPHQISVGQVIHFYPGSGLEAPGLKLKDSSANQSLTPQTPLSQTRWWLSEDVKPITIDMTDVIIPPPTKVYPKALEAFPPSIPNWYFQSDSDNDKPRVELIPVERTVISSILSLPFFIAEELKNIKGKVFEIEKNAKTASERDYLFIQSESELKTGDILTVMKSNGRVRDPDALNDFPNSYVVQGEVQIEGKVEGLFKAKVILALYPIEVGSVVIMGKSPKMNLTEPGVSSKISAMIIGGENDTTRTLFGPQSVIYLNRGADDGVKVNQSAPIMALHRMRHPESTIFSNTWKIGEIKVVKVEPNYATAIVMEASEGISPGDIVGEFTESDAKFSYKKLNANTHFGFNDDGAFERDEKQFKDLLRSEEIEDTAPLNRQKSNDKENSELLEESQGEAESDTNQSLEDDLSNPETDKAKESKKDSEESLDDF
ncbi:MAG: hypothetical protein RJB66_1058 [Pseudomonadota bacterium]